MEPLVRKESRVRKGAFMNASFSSLFFRERFGSRERSTYEDPGTGPNPQVIVRQDRGFPGFASPGRRCTRACVLDALESDS
jgi:hypothetical protein